MTGSDQRMAEHEMDNRRIALAHATTLTANGVTVDGEPNPLELAKKFADFLNGEDKGDGER